MVTSNNNPPPPDPLASFFGAAPQDEPNLAPRDNGRFIAAFAEAAEMLAAQVARSKRCGCKTCVLKLPALGVNLFMTKETIAAAYTGDTSKLDAVAEFVEKLNAPKAA